MLRARFRDRCGDEQILFTHARGGPNLKYFRDSVAQRSCLVEQHGIDSRKSFQVQSALDDRSFSGGLADGSQDRQRSACRDAASARHDHDGNR